MSCLRASLKSTCHLRSSKNNHLQRASIENFAPKRQPDTIDITNDRYIATTCALKSQSTTNNNLCTNLLPKTFYKIVSKFFLFICFLTKHLYPTSRKRFSHESLESLSYFLLVQSYGIGKWSSINNWNHGIMIHDFLDTWISKKSVITKKTELPWHKKWNHQYF